MKFDLSQYEPVDERLERFWGEHPGGRIETMLLSDPNQLEECVVRAEVYFDAGEPRPRGTGMAFERRGGGGANQTSHLENAETSAIGRALASCGYKAKRDSPRASREEMEKVSRAGDHRQFGMPRVEDRRESSGDRRAQVPPVAEGLDLSTLDRSGLWKVAAAEYAADRGNPNDRLETAREFNRLLGRDENSHDLKDFDAADLRDVIEALRARRNQTATADDPRPGYAR